MGQVGGVGGWNWWVELGGGAGGLVQYVNRRPHFFARICLMGLHINQPHFVTTISCILSKLTILKLEQNERTVK